MTYRPNPDDQDWLTVRDRLMETIAKWQGRIKPVGVALECSAGPRRSGQRLESAAERAVSVTFAAGRDAAERTVTVDRWRRPVDNLWALAIGLEQIRLNELRGIDDVARQMYAALPAPKTRDPYEVLGVRPDAPFAVIDAAYRARAKTLHPDAGGTGEQMAELNAAYEEARQRNYGGG